MQIYNKTQIVHQLMKDGIDKGVFPGGVILAAKNGHICFFEAYGYANIFNKTLMKQNTVFDLASLTKPLATTLAVMKLVQNARLDLNQPLASLLPECDGTDKKNISLAQLLTHTSGLPAYQPYYLQLCQIPFSKRKSALRKYLINEPLVYSPNEKTLYSDLGFMMLEWVLENITDCCLDVFVAQEIYAPMGISSLFFPGLNTKNQGRFAATEKCPWRKKVLEGQVHDDNAYIMGGVAGHAGLFGDAQTMLKLLFYLMEAFNQKKTKNKHKLFQKDIIKLFLSPYKNSGRTLGFDRPSLQNSSCGHYFSENTVGHLGFTGTSFWMDLAQSAIVILLTNRVHPSRDNWKIRDFRPRLHNAVMQAIGLDQRVL